MNKKRRKASPFGRGGIAQAMTERASPSPESRYAAISRFFDRAMLSLRLFLSVSVLALSVTFGDSSPKGRAKIGPNFSIHAGNRAIRAGFVDFFPADVVYSK